MEKKNDDVLFDFVNVGKKERKIKKDLFIRLREAYRKEGRKNKIKRKA